MTDVRRISYDFAERRLKGETDTLELIQRALYSEDAEELRTLSYVQAGVKLITYILLNPNTPEDVVLRYIDHSDPRVQRYAATNPNLPVWRMERIIDEGNVLLQCSLAENLVVPQHLRIRLVTGDLVVADAMARLGTLDFPVLEALSKRPDWCKLEVTVEARYRRSPIWVEFKRRKRAEELGLDFNEYPDYYWDEI